MQGNRRQHRAIEDKTRSDITKEENHSPMKIGEIAVTANYSLSPTTFTGQEEESK
jgi:hypothetical protein